MGITDFFKKKKEIPEPEEVPAPIEQAPQMEMSEKPYSGPADMPPPIEHPPAFAPESLKPKPLEESKDLQLINAKLDVLKATLDNINQRLERLEKIAAGEQTATRWR